MQALVVIPAVDDPARIPCLPLQPVAGLPLVARAIRTAKAARRVQGVVVLTNSPNVYEAVAGEDAEAVRCVKENKEAALLDALGARKPEVILLLSCAAPLTQPGDLDGTVETLEAQAADTAFAAVRIGGLLWTRQGNGTVEPGPTSEAIIEARSVYAMRWDGFVRHRTLFFGQSAAYLIDPERFLRIESPGDLYRARQLVGEMTVSLECHPVIYVDIDETICVTPPDHDYRRCVPIPENVAAINRLFERGHRIVYWTARGGRRGIDYRELTQTQLDAWDAKHHALLVGKPPYDLLICDKATSHIPHIG